MWAVHPSNLVMGLLCVVLQCVLSLEFVAADAALDLLLVLVVHFTGVLLHPFQAIELGKADIAGELEIACERVL